MCCLIFSRRGLSYFGVLAQLVVALLIIPLVTLLIAFTAGAPKGRLLSPLEIVFITLYCTGLCILAAVVFHGIRNESLIRLYFSIASLLFVQLSAGLITIFSWNLESQREMIVRITCLIVNALSTISYLCILMCYASHLKRKGNLEFQYEESDFYYKQDEIEKL